MDWTLIKVESKIPPLHRYGRDCGTRLPHITTIVLVCTGSRVFKNGSTTNETTGKVLSEVSAVLYHDTYHDNGETRLFLTWGLNYVVERYDDDDRPFSFPGDSGTSIYDVKCRLVGMAMTGVEDFGEHTSFFSAMTHIVEEIEERLNCKVRLPMPNDQNAP